jgi:hypothetical protein
VIILSFLFSTLWDFQSSKVVPKVVPETHCKSATAAQGQLSKQIKRITPLKSNGFKTFNSPNHEELSRERISYELLDSHTKRPHPKSQMG